MLRVYVVVRSKLMEEFMKLPNWLFTKNSKVVEVRGVDLIQAMRKVSGKK